MASETRALRYAVISGKGGVGKSVITANLAATFAATGQRTLVIDADLGLANLDVILGVNASGTIQDVLGGDRTVDECLIHTRSGFDLLPAGSGTLQNTLLTPHLATGLRDLLAALETRYDSILFDSGAGIGDVVLFFARIANEIVLVVTPEPTSMMDAYATIKILALRFGCLDFRLIVNQADPRCPEESGIKIAAHLQQVVSQFLSAEDGAKIRLHLTGSLPRDPAVSRSLSRRQLWSESDPQAPITVCLPGLADSLRGFPLKAPPLELRARLAR